MSQVSTVPKRISPRWARRRSRHIVEEALAKADFAFERFMCSKVVGDPAGAAWARWRCGQPPAPGDDELFNPPPDLKPPEAAQ